MSAEISRLYSDLIHSVLIENNVDVVSCKNIREPYFDRLVVDYEDGSMLVWSNGLVEPLCGLHYDFGLDYAKLLYYIEEDLFLIKRGGLSSHCFEYHFRDV